MKRDNKVTDIFEVICRLAPVGIKHAFITPLMFLCGLVPGMLVVKQSAAYVGLMLLGTLIVCVISVIAMFIALREKDAIYMRVKTLFVFHEGIINSMTISSCISAYVLFKSSFAPIVIMAFYISLRVLKIYYLESKIRKGTYGYRMEETVKERIIVIIVVPILVIGVRILLRANTLGDPTLSMAFNFLALWLLCDLAMIIFGADPIVAIRIKLKEKN